MVHCLQSNEKSKIITNLQITKILLFILIWEKANPIVKLLNNNQLSLKRPLMLKLQRQNFKRWRSFRTSKMSKRTKKRGLAI